MTVEQVIERLDHHDRRIHLAITTAISVHGAWSTLQNVPERLSISTSSASGAMSMFERSLIREAVLILVRLMDEPGRGGARGSNRISFPVIAELLAHDGVEDELAIRARAWMSGFDPGRQERSVREALVEFRARLDRIKNEEPNRSKLLRDFRDENLAHELHFAELRERPQYRHVSEMIEELRVLSDTASLAIRGNVTAWELFNDDVSRSTRDLCRLLDQGILARDAARTER